MDDDNRRPLGQDLQKPAFFWLFEIKITGVEHLLQEIALTRFPRRGEAQNSEVSRGQILHHVAINSSGRRGQIFHIKLRSPTQRQDRGGNAIFQQNDGFALGQFTGGGKGGVANQLPSRRHIHIGVVKQTQPELVT